MIPPRSSISAEMVDKPRASGDDPAIDVTHLEDFR